MCNRGIESQAADEAEAGCGGEIQHVEEQMAGLDEELAKQGGTQAPASKPGHYLVHGPYVLDSYTGEFVVMHCSDVCVFMYVFLCLCCYALFRHMCCYVCVVVHVSSCIVHTYVLLCMCW